MLPLRADLEDHSMINRITTRTITFRHPFAMTGLDGWQPAGSYVIETKEELLQALSFPAWRRLHTAIRLPQRPGESMIEQVAEIHPAAIEAALAADTLAG
jgi:hypothetical protein